MNDTIVQPTPDSAMASWINVIRETPDAANVATETKVEPEAKEPEAKPAAVAATVKPEPVVDTGDWEKSPTPRKADDWEKFKTARKQKETELAAERDTIKSERDRLTSEIAELRKAGPSPELDKLKAERDELFNALRVVDVEKHPHFQAHFNGRISQQVELAKSIVGADYAQQIQEVLGLPEGKYKAAQLEDLASNLTPFQMSQLGGVVNSLTSIQQEKRVAIENEVKNYDSVQAKRKADGEAATAKQVAEHERAFKAVVDELSGDNGLVTLKKRAGETDEDKAWNKGVEEQIDFAKNLLMGRHEPQTLSKAALYAASAPAFIRHAQALATENATLKEQIASMRASSPTVQGGRPNTTETTRVVNSPLTNPHDAAKNWVKALNEASNQQ